MKKEKERHNFNIMVDTFDKLKEFCDENREWSMSAFVDVAVREKLEREKPTVSKKHPFFSPDHLGK